MMYWPGNMIAVFLGMELLPLDSSSFACLYDQEPRTVCILNMLFDPLAGG